MPRYAEGTTVPISQTQREIQALLDKHGATHFAFAQGPEGAMVQFRLFGLHYRFEIPTATLDEVQQMYQYTRAVDWNAKVAGEQRRRWRARLLWLKATLEFADGDESELPTALMAYMVLPDGRTFGRWAVPQIESMYADGKMPPLLGPGADAA